MMVTEGLKGGGGEQARLVQPFQLGVRSVASTTMIGVWPSLSSRRTRTLSGPATGGSCAGTSQRLTCRDDALSMRYLIYNALVKRYHYLGGSDVEDSGGP